MSRIDVVAGEKKKTKVLVNFGSGGAYEYGSIEVANQEAQRLHDERFPDYDLHLKEID